MKNIGDACHVTLGCANPCDIMVSPLNIDFGEGHQFIKDFVRTRSSVKDIADDMKVIDTQSLYKFA